MRQNAFVHPRPSLAATFLGCVANSSTLLRARRLLFSHLPFLKLHSDVRNVVYLNWLVEVEAVKHLVPSGVKLWQHEGKTLFTALTYAHGHFGPSGVGALRALFPSPLQSNWRLYIEALPSARPSQRVVLFVKNIMSSALYAIGTRLFSDALPTHLASTFRHEQDGETYVTAISGGRGSAPNLSYTAQLANSKALPPQFLGTFSTWLEAVEFITLQDAAIAQVEDIPKIAFAEIELPIAVSTVLPLEVLSGTLECPFVESLSTEQAPLCFVVPSVKFEVISERLL